MHQVFSSAQYLANSKYRVKSRTEIFYETLYSVKQMGNCFRGTYFGSIYCIRYNCDDCFDNMNKAEEQRKVLCSFFFSEKENENRKKASIAFASATVLKSSAFLRDLKFLQKSISSKKGKYRALLLLHNNCFY